MKWSDTHFTKKPSTALAAPCSWEQLSVELTSIDSDIDDKDILRKQLAERSNDWKDHYGHLTSLALICCCAADWSLTGGSQAEVQPLNVIETRLQLCSGSLVSFIDVKSAGI